MDGGIIRLPNALVISKSIKVIFLIWCLFVFFININSSEEKKIKYWEYREKCVILATTCTNFTGKKVKMYYRKQCKI